MESVRRSEKVRKGILHELYVYLARLSIRYGAGVGGRLRRFEGWAVDLRLDPLGPRSLGRALSGTESMEVTLAPGKGCRGGSVEPGGEEARTQSRHK